MISTYKHTTLQKAAAVVALVRAKYPYRSNVHLEHITLPTISRIIKRARENPSDPTAPRVKNGRSKKLSIRDKRRWSVRQ